MKTKFLGSMLLLASSMMMAPNAEAYLYTPDTFLFSQLLGNSGEETERQALADFLDLDVTYVDKSDEPVAYSNDLLSSSWYLDVAPTTPGYFALKFGVGNFPAGTADTYFFRNIEDLTKLVWTNDQVGNVSGGCLVGLGPCNIEKLSHYTLFDADEGGGGGGGGETPEPATTALMGIGFLSLAMSYARRVTS